MTISKQQNENELTLFLVGRLDTTAAPSLETELAQSMDGITLLTFDLTDLEYISSAGLRILLSTQKTMKKKGKMLVSGANETIKEIFDMTGFSNVLTLV